MSERHTDNLTKSSCVAAMSGFLVQLQLGWERPNWRNRVLWPVTLIYRVLVEVRRLLYLWGIKETIRLPVPVVVVGNISVGGTGKTPLVIALAAHFQSIGRKPGVIMRGYKAKSTASSKLVASDSDPEEVGDEALLVFEKSGVPVAVGADRISTGRLLIKECGCDMIISDDGFQHYRLERNLDVVVIDGERGFGNGWCLPAGPLREPRSAIKRADLVICNGRSDDIQHANAYTMSMSIQGASRITDQQFRDLNEFVGTTVHAVAGIGNPERFFSALTALGLNVIPHAFPDHHEFTESDIDFGDACPVLMTEKDAVKCRQWITATQYWSVPVKLGIEPSFFKAVESPIV